MHTQKILILINYETKTFENDIAVLTLDRTVPFTKTVYPICLPPKGELFANRRAFVIGERVLRARTIVVLIVDGTCLLGHCPLVHTLEQF